MVTHYKYSWKNLNRKTTLAKEERGKKAGYRNSGCKGTGFKDDKILKSCAKKNLFLLPKEKRKLNCAPQQGNF